MRPGSTGPRSPHDRRTASRPPRRRESQPGATSQGSSGRVPLVRSCARLPGSSPRSRDRTGNVRGQIAHLGTRLGPRARAHIGGRVLRSRVEAGSNSLGGQGAHRRDPARVEWARHRTLTRRIRVAARTLRVGLAGRGCRGSPGAPEAPSRARPTGSTASRPSANTSACTSNGRSHPGESPRRAMFRPGAVAILTSDRRKET